MENGMPGEAPLADGFDTALRPGTAPTAELAGADTMADKPDTAATRPGTAPTGGESKASLLPEALGYPTRPSTAGSISDLQELGQESMMNFLQLHMHGILQPFSDSLQELHTNADTVAGTLRELMSKVDANTSVITQNSALIDGLRSDLTQNQDQLTATQKELKISIKNAHEEHSRLDQKIFKVRESLQPMNLSIKEAHQAVEDSRKKILAKTKAEFEEVRATMDQHSTAHTELVQAHESTLEIVNRNDALLEKSMKDIETLLKDVKNLKTDLELSKLDIERAHRKCDENDKASQERLLKAQQEMQHTHENDVKDIGKRLDAHKVLYEEVQNSLKVCEKGLADTNMLAVENGENFRKLVKHTSEKRISDFHKMQGSLDKLEADLMENARKMAIKEEVQAEIAAVEEKVPVLQDDVEFSGRRIKRIETIMGLTELKKTDPDMEGGVMLPNGVMLTPERVATFKETFSKFDSDSSGSIESSEIAQVLSSMGHEVTPDLVQMVVDDIDKDHSGEIDFDEFCLLMGKLIGPDGKVDMQSYMKHMSDEARQNRMIELVPIMKEEIRESKGIIDEVHSKLENATPRLHSLEGDHAQLAHEVQKLRKGLELTQEYWKGFSRGLKETKKTVRQDGETATLPNGSRMPILPPLERSSVTR
mmetsp:Transcript_151221/g.262050  ORF Transcript_151221/g.262050 Transcript_151221/m.262050 type:complete len:651 (+) Transcript_151221:70-2022(+)